MMIRKVFFIAFSAFILSFTSCDVLEQASDVVQFVQCDFSVDRVGISEVGGVSLQNIRKVSDINPMDLLALTQKVISGSLPVTMDVSVKAKNNQSLKAGITGLDWEVFMKDTRYGVGKINRSVEVLPGASTVFPVSVNFDILEVVTSDNLQQLLDLVLNLNDREKIKQLDLRLQLKPYYKVGTEVQAYPGYITIRP